MGDTVVVSEFADTADGFSLLKNSGNVNPNFHAGSIEVRPINVLYILVDVYPMGGMGMVLLEGRFLLENVPGDGDVPIESKSDIVGKGTLSFRAVANSVPFIILGRVAGGEVLSIEECGDLL